MTYTHPKNPVIFTHTTAYFSILNLIYRIHFYKSNKFNKILTDTTVYIPYRTDDFTVYFWIGNLFYRILIVILQRILPYIYWFINPYFIEYYATRKWILDIGLMFKNDRSIWGLLWIKSVVEQRGFRK